MARYVPVATKWRAVAEDLETKIRTGVHPSGTRLPTNTELGILYDQSKSGIREALAFLAGRGFVESRQGKDTVVVDRLPQRTVALVLPHLYIDNPCSALCPHGDDLVPFAQAVADEAKSHSISTLLYLDTPANGESDSVAAERRNLEEVTDTTVDGVIVYYVGGLANIDCLEAIAAKSIPLVLVEQTSFPSLNCDSVTSDGLDWMLRLADQLSDRFRPLFYLAPQCHSQLYSSRYNGFIEGTEVDGAERLLLTVAPESAAREHVESVQEAVRSAVASAGDHFSIILPGALAFAGVHQAFEEALRPEQQVLLFGFDQPAVRNLWSNVKLINLQRSLPEMGTKAVELLVSRLAGRTDSQSIEIGHRVLTDIELDKILSDKTNLNPAADSVCQTGA